MLLSRSTRLLLVTARYNATLARQVEELQRSLNTYTDPFQYGYTLPADFLT